MTGPAWVQKVATASSSSAGATVVMTVGAGITTTVGHMLSVSVRCGSGRTLTGVTDSEGNTWQVDEASAGAGSTAALASCIIATGKVISTGATITVTMSGSVTSGIIAGCNEYSGVAATSGDLPVTDQAAPATNTSTGAVTAATTTNSSPGDLVISATGASSPTATFTVTGADPDSGGTWTQLSYPGTGGDVAYQYGAASASAYSCTWTPSTSTNSAAAIASYVAAPVITTSSLAGGTQGTAYSETVAAEWGVGSYTWSVLSGSLPAGLSIGSGTGTISGTPTGTGTSAFTVEVTDADGNTDTQALSITIAAGASLLAPPVVPVFPPGLAATDPEFTAWIQDTFGFLTTDVVFRCHQVASGGQSLAVGNTVLQFDTIDEDPYSGWSATTTAEQPAYSWLAPYTGTYEITVLASLAAQGIYFGAGVSVTGTVTVGNDNQAPGSTEGGATVSWTQALTGGSDWIQGIASASAACSTDTSSAGRYPAMEITYVSG